MSWQREVCGACRGHGVVSDYSTGDFEGPKECDHCWGNGHVWRSPKDRLALYPGGPFVGFDPRPHGSGSTQLDKRTRGATTPGPMTER